MRKRLRILGTILAVIGVGFMVGGGVAFSMTQDGYDSLQRFSETQGVYLNYNEDGELVDRGSTEEAQRIMDIVTEDWGYPIVEAHLDPDDPLVNTASEYMYQMGTIIYHVIYDTVEIELAETVEYNGETFEAGVHEFEIDGRYWTDFDRMHPLEGPARGEVWTGTVHGLVGELGVGTVTHSALQLALALAGLFAGIGATLLLAGGGLIWVGRSEPELLEAGKKTATKSDELTNV